MKEQTIKAGQYYAAKYQGDNGDLIVGKVKSVRTTGEVILENLLSGKIATKKVSVLQVRNKRITKAQAAELVDLYEQNSKAEVRALAVRMKPYANGEEPAQQKLKFDTEKAVSELVDSYYNDLRMYAQRRTNQFIVAVVNLLTKKAGQV